MYRDRPEVVLRPPLLYLAAAGLGGGAEALWPSSFLPASAWVFAGLLPIAVGLALAAAAIRQFAKAGTNVPTVLPARTLVTSGLYGLSRNPIYVGLSLVYLGIAVLADSLWILALLAPLLLVMQFGVVLREERYLERKFGEPYLAYKRAVRRWL